MDVKISKDVARKVLKVVDAGLVSGIGDPELGKMCVEAAVCYAMGLPHGDNPPCVGSNVRVFKISLNDCRWSSDEARTKGMRKLAIAQLGSADIDQEKFLELVGFKCMTRVLPVIIENAREEDKNNKIAPKEEELLAVIEGLKSAKDFKEAKVAAQKARDIYSAYASAYVSAYAYASAYASASASAYAYASASAYAYASASASAYVLKNKLFSDKILNLTAEMGLEALVELKSPGCEWLDLCE